MSDSGDKKKIGRKSEVYPYGSIYYSMTQMLALVVAIELIYPYSIGISWQGNLFDFWFFGIIYFIAFGISTVVFLLIAGYFGIMLEVGKNLRQYGPADLNDKDVARNLAYRVLTSNQPRWLISLTPTIVPMITFAFLSIFYREQLQVVDAVTLVKACLVLGLTSFIFCMPFILKAQKLFDKSLAMEKISSSSDEA